MTGLTGHYVIAHTVCVFGSCSANIDFFFFSNRSYRIPTMRWRASNIRSHFRMKTAVPDSCRICMYVSFCPMYVLWCTAAETVISTSWVVQILVR